MQKSLTFLYGQIRARHILAWAGDMGSGPWREQGIAGEQETGMPQAVGDQPEPSGDLPPQYTPPARGIRSPMLLILSNLIFWVLLIFFLMSFVHAKGLANQYHHAPGCAAAGVVADGSLEPCIWEQDRVGSKMANRSQITLFVTTPSDQESTISCKNSGVLAALIQGEAIGVQVWNGLPMLVMAHGRSVPTLDNPDLRQSANRSILLLMVVCTILVAIATVFIIRRDLSAEPTEVPPDLAASAPESLTIAGHWLGNISFTAGQSDLSFEAHLTVTAEQDISGTLAYDETEDKAAAGGTEHEGHVLLRALYQHHMADFAGVLSPDGQTVQGEWRLEGNPAPQGRWEAHRVIEAEI